LAVAMPNVTCLHASSGIALQRWPEDCGALIQLKA